MELRFVALLFLSLQILMLVGQITTLVSTYWTSWDLKFNWTKGMHFSKPDADGQLVSQGHAGLWSRCIRVYDSTWRYSTDLLNFSCLHNYNSTNGSFQNSYGKICKTVTAALCVGDTTIIVTIVIIALLTIVKVRIGLTLMKVILPLLLFQGMLCFIIPLLYLSGNMSEMIDQLSGAYGLLLVVHMTPWYKHDWAFWTQVGLLALWFISVGIFILQYSMKYATSNPKCKGKRNGTELEALRG